MNNERTVWPVGVAFFIACLLFAMIVAVVKHCAPAPAIDADRAAVRVDGSTKTGMESRSATCTVPGSTGGGI